MIKKLFAPRYGWIILNILAMAALSWVIAYAAFIFLLSILMAALKTLQWVL